MYCRAQVSELRTHCGRWAAKYDSLMTLDALNISSEEDPRTTTRSARLQAIERHIHTTIEHLLAHAETPLNRFLDAWANPNEALDTPEQALQSASTRMKRGNGETSLQIWCFNRNRCCIQIPRPYLNQKRSSSMPPKIKSVVLYCGTTDKTAPSIGVRQHVTAEA